MKKLYTLCIAIVALTFAKSMAQPIYTSSSIPPAGTVLTSYEANTTGISPGPAGMNQTWNFSAFAGTGNANSASIVTVASTPFAATFPTATFATQSASSMGNTGYGYYFNSSSIAEIVGLAVDVAAPDPDLVYNYSDPRRVATFPYTYQTTFTDSYSAFSTYTSSGITINQYRYGTVVNLADAYGTVITPLGSVSNTLRTKYREVTTDSSVYVGIPLPAVITLSKITTYGWTGAGFFESIYTISYDTITSQGTTNTSIYASYGPSTTGINENIVSSKPIAVYPNPAINTSIVHLTSDEIKAGKTTFIATDLQGKEVKRIEFTLAPANHKSVTIDMHELPAGLYFIRLEQADNIFTTKFIRQ